MRERALSDSVDPRRGRCKNEIRTGASIAKPYVQDRATTRTLHHATVLIFKSWDPDRARSFKHGWSNWVGIRRRLDKNRPPGSAVPRVRRAMPVFDSTIDIQHRLVVPPGIAGLRRKIVP